MPQGKSALGTNRLSSSLCQHPFQNCFELSLQYCQGIYLFAPEVVILFIKKGVVMFAVAAVISFLLFALAGSEVFVSSYNSEELSNMGVQEK